MNLKKAGQRKQYLSEQKGQPHNGKKSLPAILLTGLMFRIYKEHKY
jgi:hypothetical protein